jgi:hypothetical protein
MLKRSANPKKLTGQRNQCPGCLEYFNTTAGFERHRTGSYENRRRCLTAAEIEAKGMIKNEHGFWLLPMTEANRQKLIGKGQRRGSVKAIPGDFPPATLSSYVEEI